MLHLIQPRKLFGPPERQAELLECWRLNDAVFDAVKAPKGRPTFNELFALCKPDAVNVIANSDIYFDASSAAMILARTDWGRITYALSRWDVDEHGSAVLWNHADSQDAWIFGGVPSGIDAPFPMGIPGCDNRLAWLIEQAGYTVLNPSLSIHAYHLHNVKWRSYLADPEGKARGGQKVERIPPPYKLVKPTTL